MPITAFFVFWVLLFLFPVSNLFPFDHSYRIADRFIYLPGAGLSALLAIAWQKFVPQDKKWKLPILGLLLLGLILTSGRRARLFADPIALAMAGVNRTPQSSAAYYEAAAAYNRANQPQEALKMLMTAARLRESRNDRVAAFYDDRFKAYKLPLETFPRRTDLFNALGHTFTRLGQLNYALAAYQKAVKANPKVALPYANLAKTYVDLGQWDAAVQSAQKAIRLDNNLESAWVNLSVAYNGMQKYAEADQAAQRCLQQNPRNVLALINLGTAQFGQQKLLQAEETLKTALDLEPQNRDAMHNLAILYLYDKRGLQAMHLYKEILKLDPSDEQAKNNLLFIEEKINQKVRRKK